MPELPEVETVVRGLRPALVGARLAKIDRRRPDLRFPFPDGFDGALFNAEVASIDRRAKYILIRLESGLTWLVHLGMSGRFTVDGMPGGPVSSGPVSNGRASSGQAGHNSGWAMPEKHDHLLVETDGGHRVVYNDARRFGFMDIFETAFESDNRHLAGLGPEPLSDDFDAAGFCAAVAGRKMPVKAALLDQKIVAGLGNIYVSEALWRSGVSPRRLAGNLGPARAERLVDAVKAVLQDAIAAGGSSLRDYVQATGELGYFQHAWDAYDREGQACRRPECSGRIARIVQSGRSTFFCPVHQR